LNLENYVNLTVWGDELNSTIESVLLERLKEAIMAWTAAFNSESRAGEVYGHKRKTTYNNTAEDNAKTKQITMDAIFHELTIRNQVIFLEPPLEHARSICFSSLHSWLGIAIIIQMLTVLGVVCNLQRVQASRYELSVHRSSSDRANVMNYSTLVNACSEKLT